MAIYIDGFMTAIPKMNLTRYKKLATSASKVWMDHGALRYMECVGDDLDHEGMFYPFPRPPNASPMKRCCSRISCTRAANTATR
jgi:uncharacterized protein YbaA (DUF1428 family)